MALHEDTLVQFLDGLTTSAQLESEVASAVERVTDTRERVRIAESSDEFVVTPAMLVRVCDAAAEQAISPAAVRIVAFTIIASGHFTWSDEIVGEVLHDWSAPEVNIPLSPANFLLFRRWLTGIEPYPQKVGASARASAARQVIAELEKVSVGFNARGKDVVARVCSLPESIYRTGRPPAELAQQTGFTANRAHVTHHAVRRWLRRHPQLVESWERFSEDQRTTCGWYFVRGVLFSEIGRCDARRGKHQVRRFLSPFSACAHFIIREMAELTTSS